jgi:hypothetical protein
MRYFNAFGVLAGLLLLTAPLPAQSSTAPGAFTITAVQAKLYFPRTGTFSDDLLVAKDLELWNTVIGAGWAKQPSNATLVLVEVTGKPGAYPRSLSIELVVTGDSDGSTKLRRRVDVSSSPTGKRQEGFWIYDTGCEPLSLRARLIGQGASPTVKRQIPFRCGE